MCLEKIDISQVSVIIPCYKDAATLKGAINSVLNQTYKNIEIVVVNDASPETDAIERVIEFYSSIIYVKNEINLGLAATRNVGMRKAKGEFIAFLDADDEYHPRKIELQIRYVGEKIAIACNVESFSEHRPTLFNLKAPCDEDIQVVDSFSKMTLLNYLTGASILINRDLLLQFAGYD